MKHLAFSNFSCNFSLIPEPIYLLLELFFFIARELNFCLTFSNHKNISELDSFCGIRSLPPYHL
jgi:hypothetical protein